MTACVVIAAIFGAVGAALAQSRAEQCYGDSVLVKLEHIGVLLDIPLAIRPTVHAPYSVNGKGTRAVSEWHKQCHDEPVIPSSVYVVLNHRPAPAIGLVGGPTALRFKINAGDVSLFQVYKQRIEAVLAAGNEVVMPGGLLRIEPHLPKLRGFYITNTDGTDPNAEPLAIRCMPAIYTNECSVGIVLKYNVGVRYWFYSDEVPMENWIELDHRMRRAIESMIVTGESEDE